MERVVLLGAPIAIKDMNWEATRKVIGLVFFFILSTSNYSWSSPIPHALLFIFCFPYKYRIRPHYYLKLAVLVLQMVAGRFVNAYSTNDWMLGVAFRARYALPASIVLMLNMSSTAAV